MTNFASIKVKNEISCKELVMIFLVLLAKAIKVSYQTKYLNKIEIYFKIFLLKTKI